jgi:hypothetical protein
MEDTKRGAASKRTEGAQLDIYRRHAVASRENWGTEVSRLPVLLSGPIPAVNESRTLQHLTQ